ncbi:MAG: YgiQ family radical SAM protein [Candidatus Methanomethylophilaceae archaeon]
MPTTIEEVEEKGWNSLDVIIISGDTYIDSAYNGAALIGHWLIDNGFKVGIICQPDIGSDADVGRLGEPRLFWSVTAGCVDSMVANYTPTNKFRKDDDFTPGGINNRRPDRTCIVYTNLIKKYHKGKPVVLGGVEASLRRIVHYDFWTDSLRRSILFDSKADIITYGMAERSNLLLAQRIRDGLDWRGTRGICYISNEKPKDFIELPSYEDCVQADGSFIKAFKTFYHNNDPITARGMVQKHGSRYLVHNQPSTVLDSDLLDRIYELDYEDAVHPYYARQGHVKSIETIRNSITTHRGCYGECNFCAIAIMQGRTVVSRSEDSIMREVRRMVRRKGFNGIINDVGGPTANMYGFECAKKLKSGACQDRRCLYPEPCRHLPIDHSRQKKLLTRIRGEEGVKKVVIASGIRYDMIIADKGHGREYLTCLIKDHISGQMKIAPEHVSEEVLKMMGKPGKNVLLEFKRQFDEINKELGKDQFLTYYLIAAHPGCYDHHMEELSSFCRNYLRTNPEQIQIFTPSPSTISTMMYYTRRDWNNTTNIKSEHSMQRKQRQKDIVLDPKKVR